MPIYEYRCLDCRNRYSVLLRSYSASAATVCPRCGSGKAGRLISRFAVVRGEERQPGELADPTGLDGLDENDPVSIARYARRMSQELGEDMPPEFDEVVDRLESGQSPDEVEQALGMSDYGTPGADSSGDECADRAAISSGRPASQLH